MSNVTQEEADRFWVKVDMGCPDDCWEWLAAICNGYGRFWAGGQMRNAHRIAYELLVGPIPDGLQLDHLCRNRSCVNPAHLEPVTQAQNSQRSPLMGQAGRRITHCPAGHPYDEENTYRKNGRRHCRACRQRRQAARYRTMEPAR